MIKIDDMKTYYCRRIGKQVIAERMHDLTGRIFVQCKYDDDSKKNSCLYSDSSFYWDNVSPKRCLVRLAVQREEKKKSIVS